MCSSDLVSVPAVPLLLFYEFGHLCRGGSEEDSDLEKGKHLSQDPVSVTSSQVSIVSKDSDQQQQPQKRKEPLSTFSTVWPLTDSDKAKQAFFVFVSPPFPSGIDNSRVQVSVSL